MVKAMLTIPMTVASIVPGGIEIEYAQPVDVAKLRLQSYREELKFVVL